MLITRSTSGFHQICHFPIQWTHCERRFQIRAGYRFICKTYIGFLIAFLCTLPGELNVRVYKIFELLSLTCTTSEESFPSLHVN